MLDEPTSGLDPIVRREFIQTVIGAYQDGEPGRRTVFVSTHLISEFEGLIDEFTIIERGRDVLTLDGRRGARALPEDLRALRERAGGARSRPARACSAGSGREIEVVVNGNAADVIERLKARSPETLTTEALTLEEIFVATLQPRGSRRHDARCAAPVRRGKEVRGLAGAWLACLAALVVACRDGRSCRSRALGIARRTSSAPAALGALSIGHEYSHRTLPLLLSQPAAAARLLLVKLGVLAAMLHRRSAAVAGAVVDAPCPPDGDAGVRRAARARRPVPRAVADDGGPRARSPARSSRSPCRG